MTAPTAAQQKLMDSMMKLSRDETDKLLREHGVPGAETYYNRLSIEHDLPLKVAEAMFRSAGVFNMQMLQSKSFSERMEIAATFSHIWKALAEPLRIPEERMVKAIKATIEGVIDLTKQADRVIDAMLKDADKAANDAKPPKQTEKAKCA